jgi:purine-binding chemotaxis protein CheW
MTEVGTKKDHSALWKGEDELSVLTFSLNGEIFAIEAVVVQEILDLLPETTVPGSLPFVDSVINFRGKVIPLADIRIAFGMEASQTTIDSRIVVIEMDLAGEPTLIGIRTDKVYEVTRIPLAASEPPPIVGMRWRTDYIDALVKKDGEFIIVPNLKAIFSSQQKSVSRATA